ncbi:MAG: P63C domain-containing protein [Clostridium sp.]|nr:P63C domain-containing protein [Clostridium sp.]DAI95694.1 MAG TPA: P63C domain protein [Caudoviricetes sp.]
MEEELLKAAYQGKLTIGDTLLSCAVLEDGTRILTATALFDAFGRPRRGRRRRTLLPPFMETKALKPFIDAAFDGGQDSMTVQYKSKIGGNIYEGYRAEILPLLCEAILTANDNGMISDQQQDLVQASSILIRSFAKVGIIALIDEATGYQDAREKDALQALLAVYVSKELLPWTKTFPDEFYIELFRLRGWDYKGKAKSPYVGKLTNYLVYDRLPSEVVEELKRLNPIVNGYRKHRFFQRLTKEQGYIQLRTQILTDIAMMRGFESWEEFDKSYRRSYNIQDVLEDEQQISLPETIESKNNSDE